jgi:hypothetical protein
LSQCENFDDLNKKKVHAGGGATNASCLTGMLKASEDKWCICSKCYADSVSTGEVGKTFVLPAMSEVKLLKCVTVAVTRVWLASEWRHTHVA